MQNFSDITIPDNKPWLITGKGPTFDKFKNIDFDNYYTITLNETAFYVENAYFNHVIDFDVCEKILKIRNKLLVPYHPHINFKPSEKNIEELLCCYNDVYWYNLSTYKQETKNPYPIIPTRFFSVEAVFYLLGMQGIQDIYTLGIDGGNEYSKHFSHLKPLRNGRKSFDIQFKEIEKICHKFNITWTKL